MIRTAHSSKQIFSILVVEKDSGFFDTLMAILSGSMKIFPSIKFDVERRNVMEEETREPALDTKEYDLVFIEDEALSNVKKSDRLIDFVLLMHGQFFEKYATQIKKIITKKSLNLYEHISLTNYSFDLTRVLVIDFIKGKLNVRKKEKLRI